MSSISIPRDDFSRILNTVETLIDDFENILENQDEILKKRLDDVKKKRVKGKTEDDYNLYLKKRGISIEVDN